MSRQAEIVKKLTDKELLLNLYMTQGIMLILSLLLSWWLFGNVFSVFNTFSWNIGHLMTGALFGIAVVILELVLYKILPERWFDDGGINERVFANRHPLHIAVLSLTVAVSEEILFRGVLQTSFGIWIASAAFALIHFRYLTNPFLFLFTVILSFSLGFLYLWTGNLLTVITAHFAIDFILGLVIRLKKNNTHSSKKEV